MEHRLDHHEPRRIRLWPAFCGVFVCLLTAGALRAELSPDHSAALCAACHAQEAEEWETSGHARAMGPEFLQVWKRSNEKPECLVCHAHEFDRRTGAYSKDGVTCVSCHGPMPEDHPGEGKMFLPVTSETCKKCHSNTYAEWKLSAHGQKNIRCFDCHGMHAMHLRKDNPDQMCGSCHPGRLNDFAHATHRTKGLHCVSCHMAPPDPSATRIMGTGAAAHNFSVGSNVCARCHREMVHEGHDVISLEREVETLKRGGDPEWDKKKKDLDEERARLQKDLKRWQAWMAGLAVTVYVIGLATGLALWRIARKGKKDRDSDGR